MGWPAVEKVDASAAESLTINLAGHSRWLQATDSAALRSHTGARLARLTMVVNPFYA
jgi:hypothetical protein